MPVARIYSLGGTGMLTVYCPFYVGYSGSGDFSQSGGTNSVVNSLYLGYYSAGTGTFELSNTGQLSAFGESVGFYGIGIFTQSGGTNTLSGGTLSLGCYAGSGGRYNLNGGALVLSALTAGSGTAAFNFGGGTLRASGTLTTSLPMTLTGIGGNANVDTAGHAVMLSGQLSGPGGLNKLDTGTLTLSAPTPTAA